MPLANREMYIIIIINSACEDEYQEVICIDAVKIAMNKFPRALEGDSLTLALTNTDGAKTLLLYRQMQPDGSWNLKWAGMMHQVDRPNADGEKVPRLLGAQSAGTDGIKRAINGTTTMSAFLDFLEKCAGQDQICAVMAH